MSLSVNQHMLIEQRVTNESPSPLLAYILWFFLGGLGAHRYYLGKILSAIVMTLLCVLSVLLSFVGIGVFGLIALLVWLIVDLFLIPGMVRQKQARLRRRYADQHAQLTTGMTA